MLVVALAFNVSPAPLLPTKTLCKSGFCPNPALKFNAVLLTRMAGPV